MTNTTENDTPLNSEANPEANASYPQNPQDQPRPFVPYGSAQYGAQHNGDGPQQTPAFQPPPYYSQEPAGQSSQLPYPPGPPVPPTPSSNAAIYPSTAPAAQPSKRTYVLLGTGLLIVLLIAGAVALGGELARFVLVGVQIFPLAILAAFAYGGLTNGTARVFAYISLAVVAVAALGFSFLSTLEVLIKPEALTNPGAVAGSNPFKPGSGVPLLVIVLLLMVGAAASSAMLLRPVRALIAKVLPIDPDNFVHKIALSTVTLVLFSTLAPLIALNGKPPILELMNLPTVQQAGASVSVSPLDLIYQFVWMIPSTLVAAGWLVKRSFPEVLKRLGMVRPSILQIGAGLALGVVFAFLSGFLDQGIHSIFTGLGWPTTDTGAFGDLLKGVTNPLGAVLIGVTAGIGEEMAVRGLLQPRFGIILSNLIFTSLHALQYGWDGLLSVFIVGLALGIIRSKSNTSTSAIVHGTYDFVVVFASFAFQ